MTVYELINYLIDYPDKTDDVCIYDYSDGNRVTVNIQALDDGVSGCLDIGYDKEQEWDYVHHNRRGI